MDGEDDFELNDDGSAKVDKDGNKIPKSAGGAGGNDKKTVPYEAHQRLLDQRKADQKALNETKAKLDELLAKDRSNQDKANQDNGNFKALFEDRDNQLKTVTKENETLKTKLGTFETQMTEARKISALKEKIGGSLKKKEYYNHIDTDRIAIDDKGEIDESSLTTYAGEFVKEFKELIQFNTGKLPNGAAAGGGTKALSYEDWLKLPLPEQRARMQEVRKQ